MKIKVSSPPITGGGKYDSERLAAWLCELALAVNMGFANISYENLGGELKEDIERVTGHSDLHG